MAGFAEIKGGIGEVVVGAAGDASLILVEVERIAARTYSRPLIHTHAGGRAVDLRWGVIVEEGEGWINGDIVADCPVEGISEEVHCGEICKGVGGSHEILAAGGLGEENIQILGVRILEEYCFVYHDCGDSQFFEGEIEGNCDCEVEGGGRGYGGGYVYFYIGVGGELVA